MTLSESTRAAARLLETAGIPADESRRDAVLLARAALGWDVGQWLTRSHTAETAAFHRAFDTMIKRRQSREPIAYILGEREFFGRRFFVTAAVLIPRPETELVVDATLTVLAAPEFGPGGAAPVIVDVGTGSGCLAVTLALESPTAVVIATDVSTAALQIAAANAARLGAADRLELRHESLVGAARAVDVIVSNPPYVPAGDRPGLAPEVREHEPAMALFGGDDGLDVVRALLPAAARALRPGGWLIMEIGFGQADAVGALAKEAGLTVRRILPDLQGIPRVVTMGTEPFSTDRADSGTEVPRKSLGTSVPF